MNNKISSNDNLLIIWKDSLIIWGILFIVQIFIFSLVTSFLLTITDWSLNALDFFLGARGNPLGLWFGVLVTEFGTLLISLFYLRQTKKERYEFNQLIKIENFNIDNILKAIIFVPIIFFTGIIISFIQSFFFFNPTDNFIYSTIYSPSNFLELSIWIIFMLLIVGPVEEIVFRGIIQKGIQNTFEKNGNPKWISLIISSLLFSAFHVDISRFIPIFFMGLILGYLFLTTDSSLVCGLSHGIYNAVSIIIMFIF